MYLVHYVWGVLSLLCYSMFVSIFSKEIIKLIPSMVVLAAIFYFSRRLTSGGGGGRGVS